MNDLKKLSLEELMNIEVTLVSRQPRKLVQVSSAIQVVTNEEIRRSTTTRLPEALALVPNLQTARLNSYATIISARGFNGLFSNKLLVMIDGRTVYSPLFAGTYWDVQNVLLEDIDRIEVVSGPGGTLWGANAVNGVINVVTKSARKTQGLYISGLYGSYLRDWGSVRYGGRMGEKFYYRAYVQRYDHNSFYLSDGSRNTDQWNLMQGGFRIDGSITPEDDLTFQGDLYSGVSQTVPSESNYDGQNILGRWTRTFSEQAGIKMQAYFDRTWRRDAPSTFANEVTTYDVDFQHHLPAGDRHSVVWGLGYRFIRDESETDTVRVAFLPKNRNMPLYSAFFQDEIALIPNRLALTVGSKFLHNVYTGFEVQPTARIAFTPVEKHTFWTGVSRAVRTPSRIDVDYHIPGYEVPPGTPAVDGGPGFVSEKLIAYEVGYRAELSASTSLTVSGFYNDYRDLFSVERLPNDTLRYQIMNGVYGRSSGAELTGVFRVSRSWRLRGGYTLFNKQLAIDIENYNTSTLGFDPGHQALLQSMADLPGNFQLDVLGKFVDELPELNVPARFNLNVRLAWIFRGFEFSLNGRDLVKSRHQEWGVVEVPRSIYGKITWRR